MELFRRLPRLQPLPRKAQELVPAGEWSAYPAFQDDFEILEKELLPAFRELDNEAISKQNRYRWLYIILIFGGAMATILGITQLAFTNVSGIGITGAIVAAFLAVATAMLQRFKDHERYLNARLAAERLRSEYFLFLGHYGQYANEQDRVHYLIRQVVDLKAKGEIV
ncbi:MAG: DUF4231 domain-containing protein [Chloroflexi bacterium]|nr:MAG: DUF4231 domain-containing protein [Chloroflexota bacterium]